MTYYLNTKASRKYLLKIMDDAYDASSSSTSQAKC